MIRNLILAAIVIGAGVLWLANTVLESPPQALLPDVDLDHDRPKPQGGFYRCPVGEPRTMNPFLGNSGVLRQYVLAFTHDALAEFAPEDGSLRPALATALPTRLGGEQSSAYSFELKQGLRFSDGTPLTMDDVVFTFEAARTADLPFGEIVEATRGVESLEPVDS